MSTEARLQVFGCEIRGRCGQEITLMPVSDNLVSAQRDARHSHACRAPSVPGLFVSDFSFIHGAYQLWFTGCCWTFGIVYTFRFPRLAGVASVTGTVLLAQTFFFLFFFFYWNARHLFFYLSLSFQDSPDFPFVLFNLAKISFPSFFFLLLWWRSRGHSVISGQLAGP